MSFMQKRVGNEKDFGSDLRELRELRGWSKEELEHATKIHISIITALEENRFSDLADPYYAEIHVRMLVKALDGRVPFFVGKYRQAWQEINESNLPVSKLTLKKRIKHSDLMVISRYLSLLIIIPLVVLLGGYVYSQAKSLSAAPYLNIDTPQNHQTTDKAYTIINGKTDPTATIFVNGRNAIVEPDGTFSMSFDLPRGMTELNIVAKRRYGGEASVKRYITYSPPSGPPNPIPTMPNILDSTTSTTTTLDIATSTARLY